MTQPEHVPIQPSDRVRRGERIPPPRPWRADRPADVVLAPPTGPAFGTPGPDQGYALKLARHFEDRLELAAGEHRDDAVAGAVAVALKRAALFHRAPVVHDLEVAFTLWGLLGGGPAGLAERRRAMFEGAAHHYHVQRAVADSVDAATLRRTPADVKAAVAAGESLVSPG